MAGTKILDSVFSSGQNEGIERSILPLPQLANCTNARQRKTGRWGKRFGISSLAVTNSSGVLLGNGDKLARCIGPGFCIVDDQCAVYDQTAAIWNDVRKNVGDYDVAGGVISNPRIPGVVSGWLPNNSFYPVPPLSEQNQTVTACSSAFCLGYLWSAIEFKDPAVPGQDMIRVTATNPDDQSLAFLQDIRDVGATIRYPRLVSCGSTLVLVYADGGNIKARTLIILASGFGATTTFEAGFVHTSGTAPGAQITFDAAPMTLDSTVFLLATSLVATINVKVINATTLAVTNSVVLTPVSTGGGPTVGTSVSVVGDQQGAGGRIWVTYGSFQTASLDHQTKTSVYNGNLAAIIGTATLASVALGNSSYVQAYATIIPGQSVRVVFGAVVAAVSRFSFSDVSAAGALPTFNRFTQSRFFPLSRPFSIGSRAYLWCTNFDALSSVGGFATLLRLPAGTERVVGASVDLNGPVNCPLEMSAQDFVTNGQALDLAGLPPVINLPGTASFVALSPAIPELPNTASGSAISHQFRIIQIDHYTDTVTSRTLQSRPCDGANFLTLGALTRIDARGAVEVGFALAPLVVSTVAAGGGALTASSSYLYTCVYVSTCSNGRRELSAPATVATVALGVGQTKVTLTLGVLEVGARTQAKIEIYRTLSNGTIFHLLDTIDSGPLTTNLGTYVDVLADTAIAGSKVLYTQVGQALPNAFPPPAHFSLFGGQRLWLGGLLRQDVAQCSKLILGDQSPTFCDSDSFRIVAPGPITGLAWMDNLVVFTADGVYVVSGDGPDDSGNGEFSPLNRLPIPFGCNEPRSVFTTDEGTFFQTARGLYMLPRGFGAPVPAGDVVMDTLAAFPVIVGCVSVIKPQEETVRWSCLSAAGANGRQLVYDVAHKCWSIDTTVDPDLGGQDFGFVAVGNWFGGESAMLGAVTGAVVPFASNSTFVDVSGAISMHISTGDIRPFGNMSEGVISKIYLLAELRTNPCTITTTKTTDWGVSPQSFRVFSGAAGDTQVGQITYVETELGNAELRDAVALSIRWDESSNTEGLAFIALAVEHEQGEGLKRVSTFARGT